MLILRNWDINLLNPKKRRAQLTIILYQHAYVIPNYPQEKALSESESSQNHTMIMRTSITKRRHTAFKQDLLRETHLSYVLYFFKYSTTILHIISYWLKFLRLGNRDHLQFISSLTVWDDWQLKNNLRLDMKNFRVSSSNLDHQLS